jgi:hypothetical protein
MKIYKAWPNHGEHAGLRTQRTPSHRQKALKICSAPDACTDPKPHMRATSTGTGMPGMTPEKAQQTLLRTARTEKTPPGDVDHTVTRHVSPAFLGLSVLSIPVLLYSP